MSSDSLVIVLAIVGAIGLIDAVLLYAAYLSLSVWRGLAIPIYRSRALWMALFGIPLAVAFTYSGTARTLLPSDSPLAAPIVGEIIFTIAFITLFVWIDRMVGSVIHLDYLRRDVLLWKRLRFIYWALVTVSNVLFFSRYVYGSILLLVALPFGVIPLAYGSFCLAKGAGTTTDTTFRSYIRWFGYLGASFILPISVYSLFGLSIIVLVPSSIAPLAYCYYRMARLLVPVSKIPTSKPNISLERQNSQSS